MSDVPRPMLAGTLAFAGTVTTVLAQGVSFELANSVRNSAYKLPNKGVVAYPLSHTFTVPELQKNVLTAFGYLPAEVTVFGFQVASDDLDSGGTALVQAIYAGSTSLVTSVVTGASGTSVFYPCVPTAITEPTVLYMKVTTAATTAAAGSATIHAFYYA